MPSTGIDRRTGRVLRDLDHVRQSVEVILTTRLGTRVMRRTFGSAVPALLMRENLTPDVLARFRFAITVTIEAWEPRLRVLRVVYPAAENTPDRFRLGGVRFSILCLYRPNALQGDTATDNSIVYL